MKPLILIGFLSWPWNAMATEPVTFKPIASSILTSVSTATGSPSTASQPVAAYTSTLRVVCTQNCWFAMPVTPIVGSATLPVFLPSLVPEYFNVTPGTYVHVRMDSASGNVYFTEMSR